MQRSVQYFADAVSVARKKAFGQTKTFDAPASNVLPEASPAERLYSSVD